MQLLKTRVMLMGVVGLCRDQIVPHVFGNHSSCGNWYTYKLAEAPQETEGYSEASAPTRGRGRERGRGDIRGAAGTNMSRNVYIARVSYSAEYGTLSAEIWT
jgi:hypothetical protein